MAQNRAEAPQKNKCLRGCHGYRVLALACHPTPPPTFFLLVGRNKTKTETLDHPQMAVHFHQVDTLRTGPQPLPKPVLQRVQYSAY
jgi:hypothetical protein